MLYGMRRQLGATKVGVRGSLVNVGKSGVIIEVEFRVSLISRDDSLDDELHRDLEVACM